MRKLIEKIKFIFRKKKNRWYQVKVNGEHYAVADYANAWFLHYKLTMKHAFKNVTVTRVY